MSRRVDPEGIYLARRAAVFSILTTSGVSAVSGWRRDGAYELTATKARYAHGQVCEPGCWCQNDDSVLLDGIVAWAGRRGLEATRRPGAWFVTIQGLRQQRAWPDAEVYALVRSVHSHGSGPE